MSVKALSPDRRKLLAASAALAASSLMPASAHAATTSEEVRPFRIQIPEAELVDLRRRIVATRWSEQETVTDDSQGVPRAMMQGALLGDRLRLAQGGSETERAAAIRDGDRWAGYPFHPRSIEA